MKLRNRLFIVGLGVIIFLIITPVLVLFARGFKFDFSNFQIIKTGTLVVRTEPKEAEVYLNDKKQKGKAPMTLRFLLPGDYLVRVEKENYLPWSKRLSVRSQFVTWANNDRDFVALFLQSPKLVETKNFENPLKLTEALGKLPVKISEPQKENLIIENGSLKRVNPETKTEEIIASDIPQAQENQIIRGNGHVFLLLDSALYMLNDKLEKIYDNVNYTYWDSDFSKLLFANDFEVFLYTPVQNQSELILRSTTKIAQPLSNSITGYVFMEHEGKIKAVEIDGRDRRNVYVLADPQKEFLVSKDGKMLYVFDDEQIKVFRIR